MVKWHNRGSTVYRDLQCPPIDKFEPVTGTERGSRIAYRTYVSYIDKSREYYAAHGYAHPYRWAQYSDVPFARRGKPLSDSTVAFVTTSSMMRVAGSSESAGGKKRSYASDATTQPEAMYTNDLSWDHDATTTDDVGSFLPIAHLHDAVEAGVIGAVSSRFYGVPTDYSQRRTKEIDAPDVVQWCKEDGVDAVILVPL